MQRSTANASLQYIVAGFFVFALTKVLIPSPVAALLAVLIGTPAAYLWRRNTDSVDMLRPYRELLLGLLSILFFPLSLLFVLYGRWFGADASGTTPRNRITASLTYLAVGMVAFVSGTAVAILLVGEMVAPAIGLLIGSAAVLLYHVWRR
ncbi:MAG: hypothetical protein ABEK12_02905 [Candidatus Nanohaloarchaea archaeon]